MGCTESVPVVDTYNRNQQQNYSQPNYSQYNKQQNYSQPNYNQNYPIQNNTQSTNNSEDPVNIEKTKQYTYVQTNQSTQQNYQYPQQSQQYAYQQQYYTNAQQMPYQQYYLYQQPNQPYAYQQQRVMYNPNQQQTQPSLLGTVGAVAGGVILGDMISDALFD